MIGRKRGVRKL